MKRSEAVRKLSLCLSKIRDLSYMNGTFPTDEYVINKLLQEMEDLGIMSPPFSYESFYKTWREGGDGRVWDEE